MGWTTAPRPSHRPLEEATEDVIDDVTDLVDAGTLNNCNGNALISKLEGAIDKIEQVNLNAAVNKLEAFINNGTLTSEEGQALIDAAQAIIDQINASARMAEAGPALAATEMEVTVLPETFALHGNYPNPFNPSTEIRLDLPEAVPVRLVVYDVRGREVARLVDGRLSAGQHRTTWDAPQAPSGVYIYRIEAGAFTETQHMVLLR